METSARKGKALTSFRFNEIVLSGFVAVPWGLILILAPRDIFQSIWQVLNMSFLHIPDWTFGILLLINGFGLVFFYRFEGLRMLFHATLFGCWCFIGYLGLIGGVSDISLLICIPFFSLAVMHAEKWWRLSQEREFFKWR